MVINWGPIGKEVYERTYSRRKADGSKETWPETVKRVVDGNLALVDSKYHWGTERKELTSLISKFALMPAGRQLWVTGISGRQFIFNCHTAGWTDDITDHYSFTFDELMKGGGIGSNYSNRHIMKYDPVSNGVNLHIVCDNNHPDIKKFEHLLSKEYHHEWTGCHPVEDSREGWTDALVRLLRSSYGAGPTTLVLDVSRIRPYGSPIRSFGGTASGPAPLVEMLTDVCWLLTTRIGKRLSSLDHMTIDHYIATCVVAGNVRRSARMSIKYWNDPDILEFIECKSDKARIGHWTTNISVEIDHSFFDAYRRGDERATLVYRKCIEGMYKGGEPGFWNSSLAQVGEIEPVFSTNPCGEISMGPFENCNLGHVNLDSFWDKPHKAHRAFQLMTRFLIRATFADITNPLQREIVDRNRRIGVGFFGFQGWICKQGIRYSQAHRKHKIKKLLKSFYDTVRAEARDYSFQLRIPEPVKVTTLAPTGTTAQLPGKSASAQAIYAKYFIRRVRVANNSPQIEEFAKKGIHLEPCVYSKDTMVASFVCKDRLVEEMEELGMNPNLVEDQSEISLSDSLALQAMIQREFVDNSISFTVNLPEGTPENELYDTVIRYLPELKGTTIILGVGDRPQPPFTRLSREEYEKITGPKYTSQGEMTCKDNVCPIK